MTGPAKEPEASGAAVGQREDKTNLGVELANWARIKLRPVKERFPVPWYIAFEGKRYVWQAIKNCIKPLIGRKPYHDEGLYFYRRYILHRLGLRRIRAITSANEDRLEGAGSQAFRIMRTINLARATGLTYMHSPFVEMAHADRPMQEWVAAWESVFNLGAGELPYDGRTRGAINLHYRMNTYDCWPVHKRCFGWKGGDDEFQQRWRALIPEFRRRYYLNKTLRTTNEVTVAVHIRRGDVSTDRFSNKYTATEMVLQIAGAVKAILDAHAAPSSIRIYSQGAPADFAELSPLGAELVLDADPIWTFQELVEADILVVGQELLQPLRRLHVRRHQDL